MKYIIRILFMFLALTSACMITYAKQGDSCGDPILLTPDYQETIYGEGSVWYVANTFDLPLAIVFYPTNPSSEAPELYLDFGCTPGVYDDPILCSLFCSSNSAYISMPYKEIPAVSYDSEGRVCYRVEFGQFYRDMLLQQGIDYNVKVYVRVLYHGGGTIGMAPNAFNNCMDGHKFMHLGDTVQVQAYDKDRHVIVPYVQWQYDSIRYVWQGEQECRFAVGNKCGFDPTGIDATIIDAGTIKPGGVFKVSSELLMQYVSDQKNYPNDAGMYFAKFYSEAPGVMKIEKIPAPAPEGEAELLKYGTKSNVFRNDTNRVYAMPSSWVKSMQFTTPTSRIFKMYIGQTSDFYTTDAVFSYQFDKTDDGHQLFLMEEDLAEIWKQKQSTSNYLYVRFECSDNTTVLPQLWTPSACQEKAERIVAGEQFDVSAKSKTIYSLFYEEWKGGDMTVEWTSTQAACPFYIADTCEIPNSETEPVFFAGTAPKKSSTVCSQDTVASWASYVDPDGFLYIRFYSTAKGKITVSTSAPEEEDPICDSKDTVDTVSAWDSYEWHGMTYTKSGTYFADGTIDEETGCPDTLFTLYLTIHKTSYESITMKECDSLVYNELTYFESGTIVDTVILDNGNRVVKTIEMTILSSSTSEQEIIQDEPFVTPTGKIFDETGVYVDTVANEVGCDSIITYHVTIYSTVYDTITESGCDSLVIADKTYTESGEYADTVVAENLDRIITTLYLSIGHTSYQEVVETACDSFVAAWGQTYTVSGEYRDTIVKEDGCDSIMALYLTIHHSSYVELTETGFDSIVAPWGTILNQSGEYSDTTLNADGCDSITTLYLTIHTTSYDTIEASGCDQIVLNDKTYTLSGEYTDTIVSEEGDRAITMLYLTIGHTTRMDITAEEFDAYTAPWGTTYTTSGAYSDTLVNIEGCDSITTLHLTIHTTSWDTIHESGCDEIVMDGKTYTESGEYIDTIMSEAGDRTIRTLYLTLNYSSRIELTVSDFNAYTAPWGEVYESSGDYVFTTTNAVGCDSVVTLHLTIKRMEYDTIYFCNGYNTLRDERVDEMLVRRYRPYVFQSPAEVWDELMEGVVIAMERSRTKMDLNRADANLRTYYVGNLTPVETVVWSVRYDGDDSYTPLEVAAEPQWIESGVLAVQIRFLCGEIYNTEFPLAIDQVDAAAACPTKRIENGQLYLMYNGVKYDVQGRVVER